MKIAYFSPLPPHKSGISDYSAELLPYLNKYFDIELFVDGSTKVDKQLRKNNKIFEIEEFEVQHRKNNYGINVYHIGNNATYHKNIYNLALKYSGLIVLHDFALHHMLAEMLLHDERGKEEYIKELIYNNGPESFNKAQEFFSGLSAPLWETSSLEYPMNRRIIESAKGIIVHSRFVQDKVSRLCPTIGVKAIHHHCADIVSDPDVEKDRARKTLKINSNKVVFASFGHVVPAKRIDIVLRALKRLSGKHLNFIYYIVGEESGSYSVRQLINELGIQEYVKFTGYTDLATFKHYMKATDVCINLRYPIQGETSGALMRLLGFGKPVIVSNVGSFAEVPDDVCIKISIDEEEATRLAMVLEDFLVNPDLVKEMQHNALKFVEKNCSLQISAEQYAGYIQEVVATEGRLESISGHNFGLQMANIMSSVGVKENYKSLINDIASLLDEIGIK